MYMWVVSVYLIEASAPHRELTYFSGEKIEPGEITKLSVRGRAAHGIVAACTPAKDARQEVRTAGFSLQKITGTGHSILTRPFLHSVFETAAFSGTSAGAVLSALIPAAVLERIESIREAAFGRVANGRKDGRTCIAGRQERLRQYRDIAYRMLEKRKSTLIIAPTIAEAERIADNLSNPVLFHSDLGKKRTLEAWSAVAAAGSPVIAVGTQSALSLPREDWGAVILERSSARGFERAARPYIEVRIAAEALARAHGAEFVIGSPVLPVTDAALGVMQRPAPPSGKGAAGIRLVDMRPPRAETGGTLPAKPKFRLFSDLAIERIAAAQGGGERVLLAAARHGLAPHTTCDDCATPLSCPRCGSGLVLHEERQPARISLVETYIKRWFQCHYCGHAEKVNILCPVCGSWRLSMHGIGATQVAREASKLFPQAKVFVADDAAASQPKAARRLAADFERSRGILVATESMLAHLGAPIPLSVVVSADSMLFVPEYSAPERALGFLSELRGMTAGDVILQTRVPEHPAVQAFATGDYGSFYDRELELRKKFRYPPYASLVRLSVSGTPEREKAQAEAIMKALEPFQPLRYPARSRRGSIVREHILIKISRTENDRSQRSIMDPKLLAFLRSLPPSVEVRVNPRQLISD